MAPAVEELDWKCVLARVPGGVCERLPFVCILNSIFHGDLTALAHHLTLLRVRLFSFCGRLEAPESPGGEDLMKTSPKTVFSKLI